MPILITATLPSCLWSRRIFPSLPSSRLMKFYRDACSALLQLGSQWLIHTEVYSTTRSPLRALFPVHFPKHLHWSTGPGCDFVKYKLAPASRSPSSLFHIKPHKEIVPYRTYIGFTGKRNTVRADRLTIMKSSVGHFLEPQRERRTTQHPDLSVWKLT